jgi:hypothetical protein
MSLSIPSWPIQVKLDPTIEVGAHILSATADNDDHLDSVAFTTSRMNSSSRTTEDTFSTTPVDLRRAVKTS